MDQTGQQKWQTSRQIPRKWAAKILCRDNDYVQNLANADEETKNASKGLKSIHQINMLCQIHPTNQTIRRQVTTLKLSSSHQNSNDTKLQTNYICIFVIS